MPFIVTRVNVPIPEEKREVLTNGYKAICLTVLGKEEKWVMTTYEASAVMSFRGTDAPCAFIKVEVLGALDAAAAEKVTNQMTQLTSETLGIPSDRIFMNFSSFSLWGFNGHVF